MLAIPSKAHSWQHDAYVGFAPHWRQLATSFNYLVRSLLEMQWHIEAKGLGCLHVDDQPEPDWGLRGKLAWLLTPEDKIDISRGKPK
jgi:hypothetical protein